MLMNDEYLCNIADELHSLNFNICELIRVLKENKQNTNETTDDDVAYEEAMRIHNEQLAKKAGELTAERIEADSKYLEQQAGLDRCLRNLGIL